MAKQIIISEVEQKRLERRRLLITIFFFIVVILPMVFLLFKMVVFDPIHLCFKESIHNDAMLNDTEYEMRVNKECWAFGIHTRDHLEYQSSDGKLFYLQKYEKKNNNQTSKRAIDSFFNNQVILFVAAYTGAKDHFIFAELAQLGTFAFSVCFFFQMKLFGSGEYSYKLGLNWTDLFTIFPALSFEVDKAPANFILTSTTLADKAKSYGFLGSPFSLYYATEALFLFVYFTIAVYSLAYLIWFILWIFPHLSQPIVWIFAKKTKSNAGGEMPKEALPCEPCPDLVVVLKSYQTLST